ncbi:N-acyl homoserine lactonase family protein [Undibacterium sp. TJN25]|uniref:N-acyl homoserine lactonase family protein n=1 Tax=Undibacterium sp. TJN25 TaxID=3413056 RepID=UPI003BF1CAF2
MKLIPLLALALCCAGGAVQAATTADRLYVLDCGEGHADDQSLWTPGENVGKKVDMSENCYLIRHGSEWLLFDTGLADSVADHPEGTRIEQIKTTWFRKARLADEIAQLGLKPSDIQWLALSHSHPDHTGNVELFPKATLLVQAAEYTWPALDGGPRFLPAHPAKQLNGDYDVFGDGSVVILSTPGHTRGHQSLLVQLATTGAVVLSGDAVHFQQSWEHQWVPSQNADADATRASMRKISDILAREHAQLWINHEMRQSRSQRYAPAFYD